MALVTPPPRHSFGKQSGLRWWSWLRSANRYPLRLSQIALAYSENKAHFHQSCKHAHFVFMELDTAAAWSSFGSSRIDGRGRCTDAWSAISCR